MLIRRVALVSAMGLAGACGGGSTTSLSSSPTAAVPPSPLPSSGCVPDLVAPDAGAVLDNGCAGNTDLMTWEFRWSSCPGAESYHLWAKSPLAQKPVIDDPNLTTSTYRKQDYSTVGSRYLTGWRWRVRSKQSGTWNPWSEERTFDVEPMDTDC